MNYKKKKIGFISNQNRHNSPFKKHVVVTRPNTKPLQEVVMSKARAFIQPTSLFT